MQIVVLKIVNTVKKTTYILLLLITDLIKILIYNYEKKNAS